MKSDVSPQCSSALIGARNSFAEYIEEVHTAGQGLIQSASKFTDFVKSSRDRYNTLVFSINNGHDMLGCGEGFSDAVESEFSGVLGRELRSVAEFILAIQSARRIAYDALTHEWDPLTVPRNSWKDSVSSILGHIEDRYHEVSKPLLDSRDYTLAENRLKKLKRDAKDMFKALIEKTPVQHVIDQLMAMLGQKRGWERTLIKRWKDSGSTDLRLVDISAGYLLGIAEGILQERINAHLKFVGDDVATSRYATSILPDGTNPSPLLSLLARAYSAIGGADFPGELKNMISRSVHVSGEVAPITTEVASLNPEVRHGSRPTEQELAELYAKTAKEFEDLIAVAEERAREQIRTANWADAQKAARLVGSNLGMSEVPFAEDLCRQEAFAPTCSKFSSRMEAIKGTVVAYFTFMSDFRTKAFIAVRTEWKVGKETRQAWIDRVSTLLNALSPHDLNVARSDLVEPEGVNLLKSLKRKAMKAFQNLKNDTPGLAILDSRQDFGTEKSTKTRKIKKENTRIECLNLAMKWLERKRESFVIFDVNENLISTTLRNSIPNGRGGGSDILIKLMEKFTHAEGDGLQGFVKPLQDFVDSKCSPSVVSN